MLLYRADETIDITPLRFREELIKYLMTLTVTDILESNTRKIVNACLTKHFNAYVDDKDEQELYKHGRYVVAKYEVVFIELSKEVENPLNCYESFRMDPVKTLIKYGPKATSLCRQIKDLFM